MSVFNAGQVRLDLAIQADVQGQKELAALQKELAKTKKSLEKIDPAAEGVSKSSKGIAGSFKSLVAEGEKIDKVKTRIDMLRGVVEFAVPIVGGLVLGIVALANTRSELDLFTKSMIAYADAIGAADVNVAKLAKSAGVATDAQIALVEATRTAAEFNQIIGPVLKAQADLSERKFELESSLEKQRRSIQTPMRIMLIAREEKALRGVNEQLAVQEKSLQTLTDTMDRVQKKRERDAIPILGPEATDADLNPAKPAKPAKTGRTGPDPAKARKAAVAALRDQFLAANALQDATLGAVDASREKLLIDEKLAVLQRDIADRAAETSARLSGPDPAEEAAAALKSYRAEIERTQAAIHAFGATIQTALAPALGEMSGLVGDVTSIWAEYGDAQFEIGRAAIGTADAISTAVISQIEDETLLMSLLAIKELGLGIATQFVPGMQAESLGHFAGAAVLGITAGISAAGGGSSSSDDQGRSADDYGVPGGSYGGSQGQGSGGDTTNVYYITADVMDGQTVDRAMRRNSRASRGTGWDRRGGY